MSESREQARWFWLANRDPWSHQDPDHWKPYTDAENSVIEEAFRKKKEMVAAGQYMIDLTQNTQYKITDPGKYRPVKRQILAHEEGRD